MPAGNIQFAKIVASPTEDSWSQIYSAGSLYAIVSLKKEPTDDVILNVIGKGIINNLEAEFFGLEEKNLDSIKKALEGAIESTPETVKLSIILTFIKESIAYVFLIGQGEIMLKRNDKKATIITNHPKKSHSREVIAGSGPLKNNDLMLLKTPEFDEIIPEKSREEALAAGTADEAAEILSPIVHGKEKGAASAAFLTFLTEDKFPTSQSNEIEDNTLEEKNEQHVNTFPVKDDYPILSAKNHATQTQNETSLQNNTPQTENEDSDYFIRNSPQQTLSTSQKRKLPNLSFPISLPKGKKKYLLASSIILLILIGSILFTSAQKQNTETKKDFDKVYSEAQKEIEEGKSLEELNAQVAQDNFVKAQKILTENKEKFRQGSTERTKIDELLAVVDKKITGQADDSVKLDAKKVNPDKSPLLALQIDKKARLATKNSDKDIFYLAKNDIFQIPASAEEKSIIKNDSDWVTPVGLGAFGSNIYLLDTQKGLMKFVAGSNGYGKTTYFKSAAPDLTKSTGMAIDTSIYILYSDGKIEKYTKGEKDTFTVTGLKKPLKDPKQLFTTEDIDNLYILDSNNSRIVKLDKSGNFKSEYNFKTLGKATSFEISEKDNKGYILSDENIYEISLN